MGVAARLICPECLRSLDYGSDGAGDCLVACPFCGVEIEPRPQIELSSEVVPAPIDLSLHDFPWETSHGSGGFVAKTVGRFQLRELLGGGGFGQVYRAYDPRLDREVALKVLKDRSPSPRAMERFFREARIAAQLDHPNLIALHDAGRDEGHCWIAYQYVAGPTLAALMEGANLRPGRAVEIIIALADGLHHAHESGVFHRDLKPGNVLIDVRGQPRLTDFGLALRSSPDPTLTKDGAVLGTPAYMSPEQAAGMGHAVDARSDVYSLGVIFYEMLCGQRPCDLPSSVPAWRVDPIKSIVPPRALRRSIPRRLSTICRKALASDLSERYASAAALASDLRRWQKRDELARWALVVGVFVVAGLLLLAGLVRNQRVQAARNEQRVARMEQPPVSTPARLKEVEVPAAVQFVGNRVRRSYHAKSCRSIERMKAEFREEFDTAEAAELNGYRACSLCL